MIVVWLLSRSTKEFPRLGDCGWLGVWGTCEWDVGPKSTTETLVEPRGGTFVITLMSTGGKLGEPRVVVEGRNELVPYKAGLGSTDELPNIPGVGRGITEELP